MESDAGVGELLSNTWQALMKLQLDSIAVSLSTNSIRRQDPNNYSDTEMRALSNSSHRFQPPVQCFHSHHNPLLHPWGGGRGGTWTFSVCFIVEPWINFTDPQSVSILCLIPDPPTILKGD